MAKENKPKAQKGSVLEQQPQEQVLVPDYSDGERIYLRNLQRRLESAKILREQTYDEFDGLTFQQYVDANEEGANTEIKPVKEKGERGFQSGTLRTKMMSFLSSFLGLNLKPEISAFNEHDVMINSLGNGMEDVIDKTEQLEQDEEKQMLRQYEMLKIGTVFVEDGWVEKWVTEKNLVKGVLGQKTGVAWDSKKVKGLGRPERSILSPLSTYLGDLRQYFISDQPYIFTLEVIGWEEARQLFESWEMWQYVSKKKKSWTTAADTAMENNAWRLLSITQENQVEKIVYQDKPNNEIQIVLNGIPMLPIGFPLTEISADGEYTIEQQNLEPIRHNFAYGKSFIFRNKNIVAILDEMMKLGVYKTQQSFLPPYLNLSGRLISKDIFKPGKMTMGVRPNEIAPVSEREYTGVTNSELAMIQEVIQFIDRNSVSQTFTGAKEGGGKVTATQIIELQRQARIMMGLLNLAAALLEKKLAIKRLGLLLKKWFEPIDQVLDEARQVLRNRYRTASRITQIGQEGLGMRMVVPTEEIPSPERIRETEETMKERVGMPVRIIALNPKEIAKMKLTWVVTVQPKEKRSSELSKMLFRAMIQDALALGLPMDPEYIKQRFAQVWEEDPAKMFLKGAMAPTAEAPPEAGAVPKVRTEVKAPGATGKTPQVLL